MTTTAQASEIRRKLVHIAFGFLAFSLKFLSFEQAVIMATSAVLFNWLILPHVGGRRISRSDKGFDRGIILYPVAVLVMIVVFRSEPGIAASLWGILAFGDGLATLVGKHVPTASLPWNREKSWGGTITFFTASFVACHFLLQFFGTKLPIASTMLAAGLTALVCAIVESLPTSIDDNLTVPLAGSLTLSCLLYAVRPLRFEPGTVEWSWIAINAALAIAGFAARSVNLSGMIGGFVLGSVLILQGGWQLYLVLIAFFIIGTLATKLGYASKAGRGLAQEEGGRRGFSHAFANAGAAALLAIAASVDASFSAPLWFAAVAALATAAADTTASEIGQWIGRTAFLPSSLRPVPVGTEGAVSLEGTSAGVAAGSVVALLGVALAVLYPPAILSKGLLSVRPLVLLILLTVSAFAGSYLESLIGSWNRKQLRPIPNGVMNFANTVMGAGMFLMLLKLVERP